MPVTGLNTRRPSDGSSRRGSWAAGRGLPSIRAMAARTSSAAAATSPVGAVVVTEASISSRRASPRSVVAASSSASGAAPLSFEVTSEW